MELYGKTVRLKIAPLSSAFKDSALVLSELMRQNLKWLQTPTAYSSTSTQKYETGMKTPIAPILVPPAVMSNDAAGVAVAQRVVTVQSGPLIRTEGSHVTIWCNVTGYKDGVEQDFEWSMYLPSAPDREIRIISTAQSNYAYAVYAHRVNSKDIYVERLSRDSAVLHITKVQAKDQGLFECYTPNTDGQYLGSYSARTNLTESYTPQAHRTEDTAVIVGNSLPFITSFLYPGHD
ncbi:hypothetical protein PAMP_003742 [Pampus punctatissimus]